MAKPNALIITAPGINCDLELAHAFELAGCRAERVHINALIADASLIDRYQLIGLPGGFSFGDAIAAGRIMAQLIRQHLYEALVSAVSRGVPIIAPCNGFQTAVQAGLLPGPAPGEPWPAEPAKPTLALAPNDVGRFVDRWVRVEIPEETVCVWTKGLRPSKHEALLPVAHGEGRLVASSKSVIQQLESRAQIAVQYEPDDNPNGSVSDIAGICDSTGLILGLMPHPERFTTFTQHPFWTRLIGIEQDDTPLGLAMFKRAVAFVEGRSGRGGGAGKSELAGAGGRGPAVRC